MILNLTSLKNKIVDTKDSLFFNYKMMDDDTKLIINSSVSVFVMLIAFTAMYNKSNVFVLANVVNDKIITAGMAEDLGNAIELGLAPNYIASPNRNVTDLTDIIMHYIRMFHS